jgi:hypothetical protein
MKAFLIPANSSEPVREIPFAHDESWRYVVTTYDDPDEIPWSVANVAFLTRKNAARDYSLKNSRASESVKDHLILRGHVDGPEDDLYGDVVVLGYDGYLDMLTDLPGHLRREDFEDFITRRCWVVDPEPISENGLKPEDRGDIEISNPWEIEISNPGDIEPESPSTLGLHPHLHTPRIRRFGF